MLSHSMSCISTSCCSTVRVYSEEALQETPEAGSLGMGLQTLTAEVGRLSALGDHVGNLRARLDELQAELLSMRTELSGASGPVSSLTISTMPAVIISTFYNRRVHKTVGNAARPAHTWSTTCGWAWADAVRVRALEAGEELPARTTICKDCANALRMLANDEPNRWPTKFQTA